MHNFNWKDIAFILTLTIIVIYLISAYAEYQIVDNKEHGKTKWNIYRI